MYRSIDAKFWTDPKIRELTPAHKLLFLYCITNSHSHVSGIYYMPKVLMQHETGISAAEVDRGIDTLSRAYLCLYDTTTEVLWVRHMLRYQHHGQKIVIAVTSQLESLHNCPLIKDFLVEYADLHIPYRYPIDTSATFASPVPVPVPVPIETEEEISSVERSAHTALLDDDGEEGGGAVSSNGTMPHPPQREKRRGVVRPSRKAPQDFVITDAMRQWAVKDVPGLDLDFETAKFLDCEFKTPHTDWLGTWRNWMRTAWERLSEAQRVTTVQDTKRSALKLSY